MMFYRGRASDDDGLPRFFGISEKTLDFQAFDWVICEVARQYTFSTVIKQVSNVKAIHQHFSSADRL
jgi:hypothetical protein